MIRRPPRSTRTDTLFPYTTLSRSAAKSGAIADLGQIAGRLLKSWSSGSLKEQQDRLNELIELADAGDRLQAQFYVKHLQRVQLRRWAAADALAAIREAKGPYLACVPAECGGFSIIRSLIPHLIGREHV